MRVTSAEFEMSAPDLKSCPPEGLPEFAFIGRSNVGKSSMVNMLTGKKDLARVSKIPGFTKLINFFVINRSWKLVDLPGYGYAKVARENRAKFNEFVSEYISQRGSLAGLFVLIDSKLPPQKIDLEFLQWLRGVGVPFAILMTKADKSKPSAVQKSIEAFQKEIEGWWEELPEFFVTSTVTKDGLHDVLNFIDNTMKLEAQGEL